MTTYPAAIDNSVTLPTAIDNSTPVQGSVVNRLRNAILAIEAELGVKPSATYGTVRARLDALEAIIANLQIIKLNKDLGGTLEEPLVIGIQGRPVSSVAPTNGQSLVWNGIAWAPRTISSGGGGSQDLFTTLSIGNDADGYKIINLLDPTNPQDAATKNYVDTHSSGGRNLSKVIYVDIGGTGDGNIQNPYGSITDAVAAGSSTPLIIIAPGDYSAESTIILPSGRFNFTGLGSVPNNVSNAFYNTNSIAAVPAFNLSLAYDGETIFNNIYFTGALSISGSLNINNCLGVTLTIADNTTFVKIKNSQIESIVTDVLIVENCLFGDGINDTPFAITTTYECTIRNSELPSGSTVEFTDAPGVLYIDAVSNAAGITGYTPVSVINGTKEIIG